MRETFTIDEVDEIKPGDKLLDNGFKVHRAFHVLERDVIDEMHVPSEGDGMKRELTAGVEVRERKRTRNMSYEWIIHMGYTVSRPVENMTDEQKRMIKARHA